MIQFGKAHYFNVGFFSCFTNKVLCHEFLPGNEPCFLNYYFLNQPYFFCSIFPPICMLTFKHVTESINFEHVCCFQGKCRFFFAWTPQTWYKSLRQFFYSIRKQGNNHIQIVSFPITTSNPWNTSSAFLIVRVLTHGISLWQLYVANEEMILFFWLPNNPRIRQRHTESIASHLPSL